MADIANARNDLHLALEYGRIESASVAPLHRTKLQDSGNATIKEKNSLLFYLETGGAAFLDTSEVYLTFTLKPQITQAAGANWVHYYQK